MRFFEKFKKKILSEDDIKKDKDLTVLTQIPLEENKKELLSVDNGKSETLKAFKKLRVNMQFLSVNSLEKKIILLTSPNNSEGKSFISANMAISYAEIGKKVIVVDADMNTGRQWKLFDIPNNLGLSNYLSNLDTNGEEIKETLNKYINETGIKRVNLITSGTVPPNSSELLKSPKLKELFKDLSVFYDVIIIDGTSILSNTDSLALTKLATSTIIVTNSKKTSLEELEKTKEIIKDSKGKIAGVIINKIKIKSKRKNKKSENSLKIKFKDFISRIKNKSKSKKSSSKRKLLDEAIKEEEQKLNVETKKVEELKVETKKIEEELKAEAQKLEEDLKSKTQNVVKNLKGETKKQEKQLKAESKKEDKKLNNKDIDAKSKLDIEEKYKNVIIENKATDNNGIFNRDDIDVNKILDKIKADKPLENVKINISDGGVEIEYDEDMEDETEEKENAFSKLHKYIKNLFSKKDIKSVEKDFENQNNIKIDDTENTQIYNESNNNTNNGADNNFDSSFDNNTNNDTDNEMNKDFVLTVVDAKNAYCRVFSKYYFTEKLVSGLDKEEGIIIDFYSQKFIDEIYENIFLQYNLTKDQIFRVDPLIYCALRSYDDSVRIEKRIKSEFAKIYVLCMSKEYNKLPKEDEKEFEVRCQRLRRNELSKFDLEIEYKLDNIWSTNKMKLKDKITMNKYAKLFEVDDKLKNEYEIQKSKNNKAFYEDMIKAKENYEKNLEQKNNIENKEADDSIVVELDRKLEENASKSSKPSKPKHRRKRELTDREEIRRENLFKKNKKMRIKREKRRLKEEQKRKKYLERKKQKEASRIEEELLEDNLYPKTKSNKDLFS